MKEKKESKLYQKHRNIKFQEYKSMIEFAKKYNEDLINKSKEEINNIINSYIDEESIEKSIRSNLDHEFNRLVRSEQEIFINELNEYPEYLKLSDKNGWTLLHYLAMESHSLSTKDFAAKLNLLVKKGIDFNKKSDLGDTAAHIVALRCGFHITNVSQFPLFISLAVDNGFDMNILGKTGQTVLQIASSLQYNAFRFFDPISNVQTLVENIPNLDLDQLSVSGATALFYAIKACRLDEATILLNAGADPFHYGNPECNPLTLIDHYLANNNYATINFELNEIKQMILQMIAISEPIAMVDIVSFNY